MDHSPIDRDFDADPPVNLRRIEAFIRDELNASERKEVAVIIDGCATWYRAYDEVLRKVRGDEPERAK